MQNIILRGGLLNINSNLIKHKLIKPINVLIYKSSDWTEGILYIRHIHMDNSYKSPYIPETNDDSYNLYPPMPHAPYIPRYRLNPDKKYNIEIIMKENKNTLAINDKHIYNYNGYFDYIISVKLNEDSLRYKMCYTDFYKYY